MINYSIVMRSVNTNLFEINQAKARIKAAKAAQQEPLQEDLDLVKTETQNAYAIAQYAEVMNIEKFAKHIASHGCVYSRADISAILYMAVDCMREQLLEGKKIRLGDLGDFSILLSSKGAESAEKFSAQNITGVKVAWDCGTEFKNLMADAEFNLVASREVQAKLLKAIKAGESKVDLNAATDNGGDDEGDGGPNSPGGGSQSADGGSQSSTPTKYSVKLAVQPEGSGSVSGAGEYEPGTTATIKAIANEGYKFKQWDDGNTSEQRSLTVDKAYTLKAVFENDPNSI